MTHTQCTWNHTHVILHHPPINRPPPPPHTRDTPVIEIQWRLQCEFRQVEAASSHDFSNKHPLDLPIHLYEYTYPSTTHGPHRKPHTHTHGKFKQMISNTTQHGENCRNISLLTVTKWQCRLVLFCSRWSQG